MVCMVIINLLIIPKPLPCGPHNFSWADISGLLTKTVQQTVQQTVQHFAAQFSTTVQHFFNFFCCTVGICCTVETVQQTVQQNVITRECKLLF